MGGEDQRDRDAMSLLMLGWFFTIMGALVLIATFWTLHKPHAMVVNLTAGGVLALIGVLMLTGGYRARRRG